MIDSGASVHVCPPDHDQENRLRKSSKTRPLLTASRAAMKQHGMRQVSCDTVVGKITTDYQEMDVRRPIWSLGSMMDSGCNVHFTKNRCWISIDDGKELDMIRSCGVQKSSKRHWQGNTLRLQPWVPLQKQRWTVMESQQCVSRFPRDRQRPQLKRERCTRLQDTCLIETGVNGALRRERRTDRIWVCSQTQMKPCQELSLTLRISDERRIKYCQFLPSMQSMLVLRTCQQHFVPRKQ